MIPSKSSHERGMLLLRLGPAILFLWVGFSQLFDGINWVSWVPEWAVNLLNIPPAMIVLLNGLFEVVAGALLAFNIFTRWVALALALHLLVLVIEIGLTPIGMRDFGLMMATFALVFLAPKPHTAIAQSVQ